MKTQSALAAKEIRTLLKKYFPLIKFSVTSENYSGGDSVNVKYTNGVPTREVEKLINKYQYGHFDGMTDMYEYSNSVEGMPQTKYLFVSREVSQEFRQSIKEKIAKDFGIKEQSNEQEWFGKFNCWSDQVIWKTVSELTI